VWLVYHVFLSKRCDSGSYKPNKYSIVNKEITDWKRQPLQDIVVQTSIVLSMSVPKLVTTPNSALAEGKKSESQAHHHLIFPVEGCGFRRVHSQRPGFPFRRATNQSVNVYTATVMAVNGSHVATKIQKSVPIAILREVESKAKKFMPYREATKLPGR
jgi:hypothetical protein